ncbi:MAG: metallophosphoesterase family protein [Bacteroidales bacterium]|nr:metallophosphoesterase family protein [Bacteroidales bacterium]
MLRIGLISDTHGSINPRLFDFFKNCDEIWHAGDIGDIRVTDALKEFRPLVAVYGNIDGHVVRSEFPSEAIFIREEAKIYLTHIGGYPGKYANGIANKLGVIQPDLFVCGHSHILKVMFDQKRKLLFINPGAAGNSGLHTKITLIRFAINGRNFTDLEILEIDR